MFQSLKMIEAVFHVTLCTILKTRPNTLKLIKLLNLNTVLEICVHNLYYLYILSVSQNVIKHFLILKLQKNASSFSTKCTSGFFHR